MPGQDGDARVVIFPLLVVVIGLACTVAVTRDLARRPRPDKAAWAIAFALFAIAAGAEVAGSTSGWTPLLVRTYYLSGAVLVVGFLALGELYLLAGKRIAAVAPGITLLVTAFAASTVWSAPLDEARLAADGWDALSRPPGSALYLLAIGINAGGTVVLVGGLLWSAWRFRRLGTHRNRMLGCLLISAGTLAVASGGALTRLGDPAYLYIAMAAGVATIFAGYLQARRPEAAPAPVMAPVVASDDGESVSAGWADARDDAGPIPDAAPAKTRATRPVTAAPVPLRRAADALTVATPRTPSGAATPVAELTGVESAAVAFVEALFLPLADDALIDLCREWSVSRPAAEHMDRAEARRVWSVRLRLSPAGQRHFDGHSTAAMRMVSEVFSGVLIQPDDGEVSPGVTSRLTPGEGMGDETGRRPTGSRAATR